jgi:kinetochore protein Mis13/DSN1
MLWIVLRHARYLNIAVRWILTVRAVYEEEVDGFAFRRKNTKRSQAEEPVTVAPEPAVASIPEPRRKKSPVAAKVVVPTRETRRRSARLSSENEVQLEAASKPQPKPRKSRKVDPPKSPPIPEVECRTKQVAGSEQKLEVNKARSKGTTIALPFADTPVIKRNKEMRAAHGGRNSSQNRRSSSGLRGRRASSLIDSGTSNGMRDMPPLHELASAAFFMARNFQTLTANMPEFNDMAQATEQLEDPFDSKHVKEQNLHANLLDSTALPHSEVEISDFFKLIEQSLPEQKRMRHLLMWSSERAVLSKPRPADGQSTNETIAVESGESEDLK